MQTEIGRDQHEQKGQKGQSPWDWDRGHDAHQAPSIRWDFFPKLGPDQQALEARSPGQTEVAALIAMSSWFSVDCSSYVALPLLFEDF